MTYATASYLLRKHGRDGMRLLLRNFRQLSKVTIADERVVDDALASKFVDYEDALQYYSALRENVEAIITRNTKDFANSSLPVFTPDEFYHRSVYSSLYSSLASKQGQAFLI